MEILHEVALFLAAAVIAVPLFRKLGFGAVLGYMVAGLVVGPWGLAFIQDADSVLHFAEIGVVFLLFIIGLELQPRRLWVLRRAIFGLGFVQVAVTGTLFTAVAWQFGVGLQAAWVIGFALSLSSTAFVLQLLGERRELTSPHGRAAFGVLLFQDLAVIPMLALIPVAAGTVSPAGESLLFDTLQVIGVVVAMILGGHYLLRPVFSAIAAVGIREIFTAAALLLVLGTALLMESVGLSMGLGAFLAGVLVADSAYRHQLEADIEPFKGLLLGLFFMSVGMSANLGLLAEEPAVVVGIAAALVAVKFAIVFGVARFFNRGLSENAILSLYVAQGGEFAFVLFGAAEGRGLLDPVLVDRLVLAVTLSMVATPVLVMLKDGLVRYMPGETSDAPYDVIDDVANPVIIAGFGRFGQIIGRVLSAQKIGFTALESNAAQVDFVRRYGGKLYYGDATRLDLLRAAHADRAKVFVLAVEDVETSVRIAEMVVKHFPHLKLLARARNRHHAHRLMGIGARVIVRETFYSSLKLSEATLEALGQSPAEAGEAVDVFGRLDRETLEKQFAFRSDEEALIQSNREAARELEELFESDQGERQRRKHDPTMD